MLTDVPEPHPRAGGVIGVEGDALRYDFDEDALLRLRTPWLDLHARAA